MKLIFVILSMLCVMVFPNFSRADAQDVSILGDGKFGAIRDICSFSKGLAILSTKGVFLLNQETGQIEEELEYNSNLSDEISLVSVNGQLYAIQEKTGEVYDLQNESTIFAKIPDNILTYEDQGEKKAKDLLCSLGENTDVFFLLNSFTFESGDTYELYRMNTKTEQIERMRIPDIRSIWSVENDQMLIGQYSESDGCIHPALYDLTSKSIIRIWEDIDITNKNGLCLDPVTSTLYYTANSGKVYSDSADHHTFICAYLPLKNQFTEDKACLLRGAYAYLSDGNLFVRSIRKENAEITILTIKGTTDPQLLLEFSAAYPQISINLVDRTDDMEDLQRSLILSDDRIDLYIVTSDGLFSKVKEKKYAYPLNESSILMEQVSHFYSWAQDVLMDGENLIALPASIDIGCWTINKTKWKALDIGNAPGTMEELFTLISNWQEDRPEDDENVCMFECLDGIEGILRDLVRYYLLIYESEDAAVTFNQEDFRSVMEAAMRYKDVFQSDGNQIPLLMNYAQYFGAGYNDSDVVTSICPPRLTDRSPKAVRGTMDLWILNPASNNKEEAMMFLEFWLTHMDIELRYRIDESCTQPVRPLNYEDRKQYLETELAEISRGIENDADLSSRQQLEERLQTKTQQLNDLEQNSWIISSEDLQIYQQIAPYVRIPLGTIYPDDESAPTMAINQIIERYASEQISIDDFIRLMDEKARMIFLEMQ